MFPGGDLANFMDYSIQIGHLRFAAAGLIDPGPPRAPYIDVPEEYVPGARNAGGAGPSCRKSSRRQSKKMEARKRMEGNNGQDGSNGQEGNSEHLERAGVKGRVLLAIAASLFLAAGATSTLAQSFPSKPIKVVLPYASGGVDTTLRLLVNKVERDTGANIIVENRPGGLGSVGALAVKQSAADGYTVLFADQGPLAANVTLLPNSPYDPLRDFQPISTLWYFSPILMVSPNVQAKSVAELAKLAKEKEGGLSYASPRRARARIFSVRCSRKRSAPA